MPRPVSLSPELLQTFVSVVRHEGNAVVAAEALGINQPSMSKRLAQLQHAGRVLRKPWLERHGKTWKLTKEGERMLPSVEDVVYRYEQLRHFADASAAHELTVACGQDAAAKLILDTWKIFSAEHRDVPVRIASPRGEARIEGVANGLFELALVTHSPDQIRELAHRDLHVEDLFTDPLVLACLKSSSLPFFAAFNALPDAKVSAKALAAFPLALPGPGGGLRKDFETRVRTAGGGVLLRPVIEGPWAILLRYVEEGFAVGLLPRSVVKSSEKTLVTKVLAKEVTPLNTVRLICRKRFGPDAGLDLTPAGTAFVAALNDAKRSYMTKE